MDAMRGFLNAETLASPPDPVHWHQFMSSLRAIQGNLSNAGSFISTLLAKQYLVERFGVEFDAADKPQGAPGIDIDIRAPDGKRIVAEIKTTVPYGQADFGAQQQKGFKKDFEKLVRSEAEHKFMLVTDSRAFSVLLKPKYMSLIPGVHIVNLVTGEHHVAEQIAPPDPSPPARGG
jgi:hypothetical protein